MNRCTRCTPSIRPFLSVSTRGRNSSRHPPPPNLHIHRNVPRKGEERERFRLRVSTGFPQTQNLIFALVAASGSSLTSGPTSLLVRARLFVSSTDLRCQSHATTPPTACLGVVLERPRACLSLSPVRTFTRRHAFVSDSRVGLPLLPIPFTSRHRPLLKVSRRF